MQENRSSRSRFFWFKALGERQSAAQSDDLINNDFRVWRDTAGATGAVVVGWHVLKKEPDS